MSEHVELTVTDLQRANLQAMIDTQLDREQAAADPSIEDYQQLLDAEYERRGRARPA